MTEERENFQAVVEAEQELQQLRAAGKLTTEAFDRIVSKAEAAGASTGIETLQEYQPEPMQG